MSPKKESIQQMFDDISPKYDFLNHFLSLGTDFYWRRRLVSIVRSKKPKAILDVATGTGDLPIAMAGIEGVQIIGIDISEKMLEVGLRKIKSAKLADKITLRVSDAELIPFSD
ncbi:MAG: class I SAM-dependent methyltransferase, partial [Bacteroidota bacterium]